jgi:hypothetical protein
MKAGRGKQANEGQQEKLDHLGVSDVRDGAGVSPEYFGAIVALVPQHNRLIPRALRSASVCVCVCVCVCACVGVCRCVSIL